MIAIVEYGAGNQTSVRRALAHLGLACRVTADADELMEAAGVIFPGVGAAGQAMAQLRESGLDRVLGALIAAGRPLLGICVGCQILLDASAEGDTPTLALVPGRCVRFPDTDATGHPLRVPHMGWNAVRQTRPSILFANIADRAEFYFVHSYYPCPPPELVLGVTDYGGHEFCAAYGRPGLWAVQFHPEKSGPAGLALLANFAAYARREARHA